MAKKKKCVKKEISFLCLASAVHMLSEPTYTRFFFSATNEHMHAACDEVR